MLNINEIKKKLQMAIFWIGGGGLMTLIGLSLPYIAVSFPQGNKIVFDGFTLYYLESIPQVLGCFLSLTSTVMLIVYVLKSEFNNLEKKIDNLIGLTALSIMSSFFGLFLTILDILDSMIKTSTMDMINPISIQIGFIISMIGPILCVKGFWYLIKIKSKPKYHNI